MTNPKEGDPPRMIYFKSWNKGWSNGFSFSNNIVINQSTQAVYAFGNSKGNRFNNNFFFGVHPASEPADSRKLISNPLLARPGEAGDGIPSAIDAYALQPRSPAILAGRPIARDIQRDLAGRRIVRMNGRVDLGALTWKPGKTTDNDE
jgi:hypothetical protein